MCKSKRKVGGKRGSTGFYLVSKNFELLLLPRFDLLSVNKQVLAYQWDYGDTCFSNFIQSSRSSFYMPE